MGNSVASFAERHQRSVVSGTAIKEVSTLEWRKSFVTTLVAATIFFICESALAGPIQIDTIAELQNIQNNLSGDYVLGSNIDASGFDFTPIGSNPFQGGAAFTGTFNGQGHTISNLTINRPSTDNVGLFGYVIGYLGYLGTPGIVENVHLTNATVVGHQSVGGILGYSDSGHVANVSASGTVHGDANVGGIVGIGGDYYGSPTITNSFSAASVSGSHRVGGLVGFRNFDIKNSYSTGAVTGTSDVGGLAGQLIRGRVSTSYSAGAVTGASDVGGLIGASDVSTFVSDSYWDTQTTHQSASAGGVGLSTAQLKSGTLPAGFSPTAWSAAVGRYPTLISNPPPAPSPSGVPYSDTLAAKFSGLVYSPASDIQASQLPLGWSVLTVGKIKFEVGVGTPFHAIAFRGPHSVVLAFEGTGGSFSSSGGFYALIDAAFSGKGPGVQLLNQYVTSARLFLDSVETYAHQQGLTIHLAGHSLGGGIAQILGNQTNIDTATFNAPGTASYMESQGIMQYVTTNTNIRNYRMEGDLVSLLPGQNTQVGEVITLSNGSGHNDVTNPSTLLENHMCIVENLTQCSPSSPPVSTLPAQAVSTYTESLYPGGDTAAALLAEVGEKYAASSIVRAGKKFITHTFLFPVIAGAPSWLDPSMAPEYDFAIGNGNPNFASVLLPAQSDPYDLQALIGMNWVDEGTINPLSLFNFGPGGVSQFKVFGADQNVITNAPFIVRVTFAGDGMFTGTMTSITPIHTVSDPTTLSLIGFGLVMMVVAEALRRRSVTSLCARRYSQCNIHG